MPMTWDDLDMQTKQGLARSLLVGSKPNAENMNRAMQQLSENPRLVQKALADSGVEADQQEGTGQNSGQETSTTSPADLAGKIDRMNIDDGSDQEPDGDGDELNPSPLYNRRGMQSEGAADEAGMRQDDEFRAMDGGRGPATDGQLEAADAAGYLNRQANDAEYSAMDGGRGPATDGQLENANDSGYLDRRQQYRERLGGTGGALDNVPDADLMKELQRRAMKTRK